MSWVIIFYDWGWTSFKTDQCDAEKDVWAMGVQAGKRRKCPLPLHQMPEWLYPQSGLHCEETWSICKGQRPLW